VRRIVVLGDSLAVSPSVDQSFPSQLQMRIVRQGLRWTVTNAAVSGDTTAEGLRRVEPLLASDVGVLVLELGANDGLQGVPTAAIETNLSAIADMAERRRIRTLLCGMETLPTHGFDYVVAFHNVFPHIAARYGIALVPFLLAGVVLNPDLNTTDGVHPNAAGAQRIAETVWPYLEPMLQ
jgi:acyl-CoA thioesterase-1